MPPKKQSRYAKTGPASGKKTKTATSEKKTKAASPASKVSVRIRAGSKTDDYSGKSVRTIIQREFGKSKNIRLWPSWDSNSPQIFTVYKHDPKYGNNVLGEIYGIEIDGRPLSKREILNKKIPEELWDPKPAPKKKTQAKPAGRKR